MKHESLSLLIASWTILVSYFAVCFLDYLLNPRMTFGDSLFMTTQWGIALTIALLMQLAGFMLHRVWRDE